MKVSKIIHLIPIFFISLTFVFCTNSMDQMYLLTASNSSYPTGTPIDNNADGKADGIDVDGDGKIDMMFVQPIGLPATGIDINEDGAADFYMYTTSSGSSFNTKADGTGSTVSVIIDSGLLIGYDTNGDGAVDINVTGGVLFSVGGTATGVTSDIIISLTINNSSFEYLTIPAAGPYTYTFTTKLNSGYFYEVAIASSSQQCILTGTAASGLIATSDITGIIISCGTVSVPVTIVWDGDTAATPAGSRTISGLQLSLTINNTTTEFPPLISGVVGTISPFTFSNKLNTGDFYSVLIVSSTDNCTISNNTGTIPIGLAITVKCAKFTVDNTGIVGVPLDPDDRISGLTTGNSITLSLSVNGSFKESTTVTKTIATTPTTFSFPNTKLFANDAYSVQIVSSTQSCKISSNTGVITTTNKTNVTVSCAQFTVGGTINPNPPYTAALTSNMIISLSVNGTIVENILEPSGTVANTGFTFTTKLYTSDIYSVQIASTAQNCAISNNTGTITGSVSNVSIACGQFTVQGNVVYTQGGGLSGSITLELQVVSGSNIYLETLSVNIPAAVSTTPYGPFLWKLLSGDQYSVRVTTETLTGSCTPAAGATGTITNANIVAPTANINCP